MVRVGHAGKAVRARGGIGTGIGTGIRSRVWIRVVSVSRGGGSGWGMGHGGVRPGGPRTRVVRDFRGKQRCLGGSEVQMGLRGQCREQRGGHWEGGEEGSGGALGGLRRGSTERELKRHRGHWRGH